MISGFLIFCGGISLNNYWIMAGGAFHCVGSVIVNLFRLFSD